MHRGSEAPEKRDREEIESDEGGARENKTLPKFLDIRPSEEDKGRRKREMRGLWQGETCEQTHRAISDYMYYEGFGFLLKEM